MKKSTITALCFELLSIAVGVSLIVSPLRVCLRTAVGNPICLWAFSALPIFLMFNAFLLFVPLAAIPFLKNSIASERIAWQKTLLKVLRPLSFMPLLCAVSYAEPWIGRYAAGIILPYGIPLLAAFSFDVLYSSLPDTFGGKSGRNFFAVILIVFAVLIVYFVHETPLKCGDEKHYLLQYNSLRTSGNLELSDEFDDIMSDLSVDKNDANNVAVYLERSHLRRNASGKIYSYHSPGISYAFLPFSVFGRFAIPIFILLVGIFSVMGCRRACFAIGGTQKSVTFSMFFLMFSYCWLMNATRFLPEIIACGLTAWGFAGLMDQHDSRRRITSTVIAAVALGVLPFFHFRFFPLAGALALCFGLEGLFFVSDEKLMAKLIRLALFSGVCFVAWSVIYYAQRVMFCGCSSYDVGKIFFSYPLAMWAIISDRCGLPAIFPMYFWLISVTLGSLSMASKARRFALWAIFVTFVVIVTCCSSSAALNGACLQGRYLLQTIPLLLPFAALSLTTSGKAERIFGFFFASMGVLLLIWIGPQLDSIPGGFLKVPASLRVSPVFVHFWEPLISVSSAEYANSIWYTTFFVLLIVIYGLIVKRLCGGIKMIIVTTCFLFVCFVCGVSAHKSDPIAATDVSVLFRTGSKFRLASLRSSYTNTSIFDFFNGKTQRYISQFVLTDGKHGTITSRKAAFSKTTGFPIPVLELGAIPRNDAAGGQTRWYSVYNMGSHIRHNIDGYIALYIRGKVLDGECAFIVRQGTHMLTDPIKISVGDFEKVFIIRTRKGWGWVEPVISLKDNTGEISIEKVQLVPYRPEWYSKFSWVPDTKKIGMD